jgi:hypothetical protein
MSDVAPPLDPSAQEARELLLRELSKPEYQTSKTNGVGQIVKAIEDWFSSLHIGKVPGAGFPPFGYLVIGAIIVVALVLAFLLFGLPRLNRRSGALGSLFGDDDARDSVALREAAQRAAAAGDYDTAIEEQFRSIARAMAERGITSTFPGTTATGFARQASESFAALGPEFAAAAAAFDGVRYLGRRGTENEWMQVSALDRDVRASRPVLATVPA